MSLQCSAMLLFCLFSVVQVNNDSFSFCNALWHLTVLPFIAIQLLDLAARCTRNRLTNQTTFLILKKQPKRTRPRLHLGLGGLHRKRLSRAEADTRQEPATETIRHPSRGYGYNSTCAFSLF